MYQMHFPLGLRPDCLLSIQGPLADLLGGGEGAHWHSHAHSCSSVDQYEKVIKSWWRHNWKSAQVVNSHLVCDPTIWQPGFDLPQQQWSLLNHFCMEQGHCSACRRKQRLTDTDLCPWPRCCPTLSNPVLWQSWMAAYPGTWLHSADEDAVSGWPVMVHDMYTRRRRLNSFTA